MTVALGEAHTPNLCIPPRARACLNCCQLKYTQILASTTLLPYTESKKREGLTEDKHKEMDREKGKGLTVKINIEGWTECSADLL